MTNLTNRPFLVCLSTNVAYFSGYLGVLARSHSFGTWCIMANASLWYLLLVSIKIGVLDITL